MDRNKITERVLVCLGFTEYKNPWNQKTVWAWGKYTVTDDVDGSKIHLPIIEWDANSQMAHSNPIHYSKKITTVHGIEQLINTVNFLMSTEE